MEAQLIGPNLSSIHPARTLILLINFKFKKIPQLTEYNSNLSMATKTFALGKVSKKKLKKVQNFPYFSGVGGFENVIFHKK